MTATVSACVACLLLGCGFAGSSASLPAVDAAPGSSDATLDAMPPTVCDTMLAGYATGFENGLANWTHVILDNAEPTNPGWPWDEWQHGTASSGPGSCHAGTNCWATRLAANYTACSRAALVSPQFDLSACAGRDVKLAFWNWYDFWTGTVSSSTWFDGGILEFSTDNSTWAQVTPTPGYPGTVDINPSFGAGNCLLPNSFHVDGKPGWIGASAGWQQVTVPIPASSLTSTFRFRFAYSTGVSSNCTNAEACRANARPGWYIDDVSFAAP
jgi:hypothetical protein